MIFNMIGIGSPIISSTIDIEEGSSSTYPEGTLYVVYGDESNNTPSLITFSISNKSYQAEEGMTWEQWINSKYHTGEYYIGLADRCILTVDSHLYVKSQYNAAVLESHVIIPEFNYSLSDSSSGGSD